MTLVAHRELWPSFGLVEKDQTPVAIYTVLSVNNLAGDCAAYRGIGPVMGQNDFGYDRLIDRVKSGGNKIRESEARELFPDISDLKLRYRP